jgi:hypothetical protein
VPQIARSLFRQRRRPVPLNGSGKVEELFKHDCVPLFTEAQPWRQGDVQKIMLRRIRSVIHSTLLTVHRCNITSGATFSVKWPEAPGPLSGPVRRTAMLRPGVFSTSPTRQMRPSRRPLER